MSSQASARPRLAIGSPSIMIRSVKRTRCGLVNSPVRRPCARSRLSIMRLVDVLPFVPVMWMTAIRALRVAEQLEHPRGCAPGAAATQPRPAARAAPRRRRPRAARSLSLKQSCLRSCDRDVEAAAVRVGSRRYVGDVLRLHTEHVGLPHLGQRVADQVHAVSVDQDRVLRRERLARDVGEVEGGGHGSPRPRRSAKSNCRRMRSLTSKPAALRVSCTARMTSRARPSASSSGVVVVSSRTNPPPGSSASASPSGRPVVSSASSYSPGSSAMPPATTAPSPSDQSPALAAWMTCCTCLPRRGPGRARVDRETRA